MNIVIIGPQGSGKGTQAKLLAERYGIPNVSTGDIFRAAIETKTDVGLQIKDLMDAGSMVPDDLTIAVVKKRLDDVDCAEGFILDGFPRTLPQAEALDDFSHVDFVIVLEVSDDEVVRRILDRLQCSKCGRITNKNDGKKCKSCGIVLIKRTDDSKESVGKRLRLYHDVTHPLMEYYRPRDIVKIIDGEQSVEKVFKDILVALGDVE